MNVMEMSCNFANYMHNSGFDWIKPYGNGFRKTEDVHGSCKYNVREFSITMKNDVILLLDINTEKNQ